MPKFLLDTVGSHVVEPKGLRNVQGKHRYRQQFSGRIDSKRFDQHISPLSLLGSVVPKASSFSSQSEPKSFTASSISKASPFLGISQHFEPNFLEPFRFFGA